VAPRDGAGVAGRTDALFWLLQSGSPASGLERSDPGGGVCEGVEVETRLRGVLRGMAQVSDGARKDPWSARQQGSNAIGVPSAELSLGWLLASRASLRFTRRCGDNQKR